ncbi:MAG TPA: twin-arginine translocation signal domain-containing protein [Chloroflexota bacterium]|nr:twin-arginine translocation signal domain-containing protein [Chloroflexota bacterium]
MHNLSRRGFLGWTAAGAAGIGLLPVVRQLAGGEEQNPTPALEGMSQPLVAYIHNPAGGEISLMAGTQEITLHDPDLVSRLIQRAGGR